MTEIKTSENIIKISTLPNGKIEMTIYDVCLDSATLVSCVRMTEKECGRLGGAFGAITARQRRQKANDGTIQFNKLSIGKKFYFVHHRLGLCTKISNLRYSTTDGKEWPTSANARVLIVE